LHPLSSEDNVLGSKSEGEMKLSLIVERELHGMRRRRCRVNSLPRIAGTARKKSARVDRHVEHLGDAIVRLIGRTKG
jgi:hypothetical protein